MAIQVRCFLDTLELDTEPINLKAVELAIMRDAELHGIGFEASTTPLEFIGNGLAYLEGIMDSQGLKSNVTFKTEMKCAPGDEWETIILGKVNLLQQKGKCGILCTLAAPIQSNGCEVTLKNRLDQAVDLDSNLAFDGITGLVNYDDLGIILPLPPKELDYLTLGYVVTDDEPAVIHNQTFAIRPDYADVRASNFKITELTGASILDFGGSGGISPIVLWDERLTNFPNPILVNGRLKGKIHYAAFTADGDAEVRILEAVGEFVSGTVVGTLIENTLIGSFTDGVSYPEDDLFFDLTFDPYTWNPVDDGTNGIYQYIAAGLAACPEVTITFDPETFAEVSTTKRVPATNVQAYLIHETLSRVVESVTNNCVRVKSSYYGRTDSQPFSFPQDGCGALRYVTSGLKVRNAENAKFFASPQDLVKGLQAIDNTGMGLEADPDRPDNYLLRIEDLDYFYVNNEIFRCELIPKAGYNLETGRFYSTIDVGYKKWETQANFGLDEYNSNRVYRTSLTDVQNKLEILSSLVGGEYALEVTREQQFAETNEADTAYDNEIFIVCLSRNATYGYPYGGLQVEQNNIDSPENIFSPGTTYNYRITPFRNLMRWYRTIMASYPNISDSENRLYFTKGTGNLQAKGALSDYLTNPCTLEAFPVSESQDLVTPVFKDITKAAPLWKNKLYIFDYPMSISAYQQIKANPYGYVSFQCGNGQWLQGWLVNLKFKPFTGMANLTLRVKN